MKNEDVAEIIRIIISEFLSDARIKEISKDLEGEDTLETINEMIDNSEILDHKKFTLIEKIHRIITGFNRLKLDSDKVIDKCYGHQKDDEAQIRKLENIIDKNTNQLSTYEKRMLDAMDCLDSNNAKEAKLILQGSTNTDRKRSLVILREIERRVNESDLFLSETENICLKINEIIHKCHSKNAQAAVKEKRISDALKSLRNRNDTLAQAINILEGTTFHCLKSLFVRCLNEFYKRQGLPLSSHDLNSLKSILEEELNA